MSTRPRRENPIKVRPAELWSRYRVALADALPTLPPLFADADLSTEQGRRQFLLGVVALQDESHKEPLEEALNLAAELMEAANSQRLFLRGKAAATPRKNPSPIELMAAIALLKSYETTREKQLQELTRDAVLGGDAMAQPQRLFQQDVEEAKRVCAEAKNRPVTRSLIEQRITRGGRSYPTDSLDRIELLARAPRLARLAASSYGWDGAAGKTIPAKDMVIIGAEIARLSGEQHKAEFAQSVRTAWDKLPPALRSSLPGVDPGLDPQLTEAVSMTDAASRRVMEVLLGGKIVTSRPLDMDLQQLQDNSILELVHQQWSPTGPFDVGHLLVVDHAAKCIVLVARGTKQGHDILTDITAANSPFLEHGLAHKGIAQVAESLVSKIGPQLIALVETLPNDYSVVATGHSLGAGTATLVTLLLRDKYPALRQRLQCVAFAPPPTLSANSAAAKGILSFVHRHDIVPRISLHNTLRFAARLDVALEFVPDPQSQLLGHALKEALPESAFEWILTKAPGNSLERYNSRRSIPLEQLADQAQAAANSQTNLVENLFVVGEVAYLFNSDNPRPEAPVSSDSVDEVSRAQRLWDDALAKLTKPAAWKCSGYSVAKLDADVIAEEVLEVQAIADHNCKMYINAIDAIFKDG